MDLKPASPPAPAAPLAPGLLKALLKAVGRDRLLVEPGRLLAYECDGLTHFKGRAAAVVLPETTEELQAVVRACAAHGAPFTPRGAGTGLSGGATPAEGGVLIELARMNRILALDRDARLAVVQPGVINQHLSDAARPLGLFFAPDPSSQSACSLGGNCAENAGGPHGFKYGSTEKHVAATTVVLPDGELAVFGGPVDASHGLDLRGAFLGSEGTLGVVAEIVCRLTPLPEAIETLLAPFASLEAACRAVGDLVASGVVASALEALDRRTIEAVEAGVYRAGYPSDADAVLLVELDGPAAEVAEASARSRAVLRRNGALSVQSARDAWERKLLWRGRKGAFGAMGRLAPDLYVVDAVVPRSALARVLTQVCAICDGLGLRLANVFHAGDGNLHPNICYDGRDAGETARVVEAGRRILEVCVAAGGALTGEHGIGVEKRDAMALVFGDDDLDAMARLRRAFDPRGLANPGKLLPTPRA
ncbi:MAG TPA: FAD-linked oxidase C-terminal domain-containing protein, partial [Planctomycetota bacterium]|nr:FAD-linked oxidase C-terminal domain-containing protein [Planctomycetota bacterium]